MTKSGAAEEGGWGRQSAEARIDGGDRCDRGPGEEARSTLGRHQRGGWWPPGRSRCLPAAPRRLLNASRSSRRRAAPERRHGAAALEVVRPDQLSWVAPDSIHTVAPPGWE